MQSFERDIPMLMLHSMFGSIDIPPAFKMLLSSFFIMFFAWIMTHLKTILKWFQSKLTYWFSRNLNFQSSLIHIIPYNHDHHAAWIYFICNYVSKDIKNIIPLSFLRGKEFEFDINGFLPFFDAPFPLFQIALGDDTLVDQQKLNFLSHPIYNIPKEHQNSIATIMCMVKKVNVQLMVPDRDGSREKEVFRIFVYFYIHEEKKYHDQIGNIPSFLQKVTDNVFENYKFQTQKLMIRIMKEETSRNGSIRNREFLSKRKMDDIWFQGKKQFLTTLNYFRNHRQEYIDRGEPYVFNVLLNGPPGSGKTSLIKAFLNDEYAMNTNVQPLLIRSGSLKSQEDLDVLSRNCDNRVLIFEDFDVADYGCFFLKRKSFAKTSSFKKKKIELKMEKKNNDDDDDTSSEEGITEDYKKKKEGELTLSDFLNFLDGIIELSNTKMFFTTNVENLEEMFDPAFLRRMDFHIHLGKCDDEGTKFFLEKFYPLEFAENNQLENYCFPSNRWTACEVKRICKKYPHNFQKAIEEIMQ